MQKFAIQIATTAQLATVINHYKQQGHAMGSIDELDVSDYGSSDPVCINPNKNGQKLLGYSKQHYYKEQGYVIIPFDNWAAMAGASLVPENVTIQLTSQYKAVVDYSQKAVVVGCQTIPFAKVDEIVKLIDADKK